MNGHEQIPNPILNMWFGYVLIDAARQGSAKKSSVEAGVFGCPMGALDKTQRSKPNIDERLRRIRDTTSLDLRS